MSDTPIFDKFSKIFSKAPQGRGIPITPGIVKEGAKQCGITEEEFLTRLGVNLQDNGDRLWMVRK